MTTMNEERAGFEAVYGTIKPEDHATGDDQAIYELERMAFQAGAAWQRTQAAAPDGFPPLPWSLRKCNVSSPTYAACLGGKPSFKPVYLEPVGLLIGQTELEWPLADFILACVNAAAPAQPAVQVEQQPAAFAVKSPNTGKTRLYARSKAHLMPGFANAGYIVTPLVEQGAQAQPAAQLEHKGPNWKRRSEQGWQTAAIYRAENQELKARLEAALSTQSEVQRLREALEAIATCTGDDQARDCAMAALAASTGQEVEK